MRVVKKLDAGNMLYKISCKISDTDTADELHDRMMHMGAEGLLIVLDSIIDNSLHDEIQDEALVTYAHKLDKSESQLDWSLPANVLARKVRGLNAWPVAQANLEGKIVRIWSAKAILTPSNLPIGMILNDSKNIDVVTGEGILRLKEIQMPGKKRTSVGAFLNAHTVAGKQFN
jgi:methionyl-tRNA formyltransferase